MEIKGTRWENKTLSSMVSKEAVSSNVKHSGSYLHHSLILQFISEANIKDFAELIEYAATNDPSMFRTIFDSYGFYVDYLKVKTRKEINLL